MVRVILHDTRGSAAPEPWLMSYPITGATREPLRAYLASGQPKRDCGGRGFRSYVATVGHTMVTILLCGPRYEARRLAQGGVAP